MITLKLIIYSLILFILFVKIPSCKNNIVDLINIILVIILFNLILEKMINTNIQENYEAILENNYSFLETPKENNSYDYENVEDNTEDEIDNNDKDSEDEIDSKNSETNKEITEEEDKNLIKIDDLKEKTNNIVNVIKDNVKNIIDNTNLISPKKREEPELGNKFIYGYSYLHTDNWSIPEKRQPICKNIKPCKICPSKTNGFNPDLLKYSNIYNEKKNNE